MTDKPPQDQEAEPRAINAEPWELMPGTVKRRGSLFKH